MVATAAVSSLAVATPPAHAVRQLKHGEHPVWLVHRPGEEPRTLKTWPVTPIRLIQLGGGFARPQRQIAGAKHLRRAGVHTPDVCGSWRYARRDGLVVELDHVYVEGRSAWELARDPDISRSDIRRISGGLGDIVAALVTADLLNKDLKLNNVIVADDGLIWLIDTDGVRRVRSRVEGASRMLERLGIQLPVNDDPVPPAVWLPAMRRAMRPLSRQQRKEVVQLLRAHRRP
jgi:hypothetical protein